MKDQWNRCMRIRGRGTRETRPMNRSNWFAARTWAPGTTGVGGGLPFGTFPNGTSGKGHCAISVSEDPSRALLGGVAAVAALALGRRRRRSASAAR